MFKQATTSEVLQDGFEYITRDGPRRRQILGVLIVIFMVIHHWTIVPLINNG